MLKKTASLLLSFILVFSVFLVIPITVNAEEVTVSGQCGENVYYTLYADGKLVISGTGDMGKYDDNWNDTYRKAVTSVEIKDGVTSIGDYAFESSYKLSSVSIPDSVTSIGEDAFFMCGNLESITIPYGVTRIETNAFFDCGLTSVSIPDSVTYIGKGAFAFCRCLSSVKISKGLTELPQEMFGYCISLTSITIPDNITTIGLWAFYYSGLTSITIPETVMGVSNSVFWGCSNLSEINVDSNHSKYCSIDGVLFDKNVETLMFYPNGKKNSSYAIPNGVKQMHPNAFAKCNLTSVTIPDSIEEITSFAFDEFSNLTDVYYVGTEEQWKQIKIKELGNEYLLNANIHYNSSYILGDVNDDHKVNVMDATDIQKYLAGIITLTDTQKTKGDVNNDGILNVADATEIQKYLAGIPSCLDNH